MNDFHAIIFAAIALAIIAVHVALCCIFLELRAISKVLQARVESKQSVVVRIYQNNMRRPRKMSAEQAGSYIDKLLSCILTSLKDSSPHPETTRISP